MPKNDPRKKQPEAEDNDPETHESVELSYYYDDSHGYEEFDPECENDDDDRGEMAD